MKKFVLDTSVLLHEPNSIFKFGNNEVILPITVIEELDNFKKDQREVGRNARQVARILNGYIDNGDIKSGIPINEEGGVLRVDIRYTIDAHNVDLPLDYSVNDNRIINCAYINDAVIVSRDINLRVKASAYAIPSEDYKNDKLEVDDSYTGHRTIDVPQSWIDQIYETKFIPYQGDPTFEVYPNMCFLLRSTSNTKQSALCRYYAPLKELRLIPADQKTMGILPRNKEQQFALDILTDPDIKLITLVGKAGCGKSLMALIAGLQGVVDHKLYKKLLVYRPIVPMGNDIGYLPGDMQEKLAPWMQPIHDNIDFIMGDIHAEDRPKIKKPKKASSDIPNLDKGEKSAGKISATKELMAWDLLECGALTYIRGRSIPNQYIIIDDAQNTSIHEMKTIITRVGEGTKIILAGDPQQIDSPYLDSTNNGLTYVAERFKNENIAAHIVFSKSERSELAELAANLL